MKRVKVVALMLVVALVLAGCAGGGDQLMNLAKSAWTTAGMGAPESGDAVAHIEYSTLDALALALGVDADACNFESSGLFDESGHLFGIVDSGKIDSVVAMNANGEVTWHFDAQSWKTRSGSSRLSALEFGFFATAVCNGAKAVYPQNASAGKDAWHRLTDEQVSGLSE